MTQLTPLYLKNREERRIRSGHVWVFSNEIDTSRSSLKSFQAGQLVEVHAARGGPIGVGTVNPNSLIAVRMLTRGKNTGLTDETFDQWLLTRLQHALTLRERLYATPHYRLVHGESDALPGLVVDRYGDYLVAQLTSAAMDVRKDIVCAMLTKLLKPAGIVWRNDGAVRELEGLPRNVEVAHGEVPAFTEIQEGDAHFRVPLSGGQKTGWFFDQRENRLALARYVRDQQVLDVFSYVGGWGVQAAKFGAADVTCVDSSAFALECVQKNAELNQVTIDTHCEDAFAALQMFHDAGKKFDVVIVDPPALIHRRKDHKAGLGAYQRLNQLALGCLADGGILVSCSCSHHLATDELQQVLRRAAQGAGRRVQILQSGAAGPDHPVHPAIPETAYLKAFFCRVL